MVHPSPSSSELTKCLALLEKNEPEQQPQLLFWFNASVGDCALCLLPSLRLPCRSGEFTKRLFSGRFFLPACNGLQATWV
jgi:hypothetical protein